jgi:hypothetical protein
VREADIVARIQKEVKKQLPRAVYLKHCDLSSTGIPDLSLTYAGHDLWVEVKLVKEDETPSEFHRHFPGLQLATCRLLEQQGRCVYFIAYSENDDLHARIIRPHALAHQLAENKVRHVTDLYGGEVGPLPAMIDHLIFMARR